MAQERVDLAGVELSTAQVADLLGVSGEWVRRLVNEGLIEKRSRDRIPLVSAVRGYVGSLKAEQRRSTRTAAANRVHEARARDLELKVAEREGNLIDLIEHREVFAEVFGRLKSDMESLPARLTRDPDQRRKIETEIDDVFRRAADRFEQASLDPADAGAPAEADEGDDAGRMGGRESHLPEVIRPARSP